MASRLSLNSITSSLGSTLRSRKKFQFDVSFDLLVLENCTFVAGLLFGKVHLIDGGNFTAFSERIEVHKHKVRWNAEYKFPCKMYANASTGVLEACHCKISIRKETKGGRSSSKLGYVKINLAEYAGAGEVERKYLLESYNENKHKPDNSVVKVRVSLKQTYGDSIFKAPTPKLYDIDEGIGDDDFLSLYSATPRASTVSTVSGLSIGTGGFSVAGSRSNSSANLRGSAGNLRESSAASLRVLESFGSHQRTIHSGREDQSEAGGSDNTVVEQSEDTSTIETNSTTKDTASLVPSRTTRQVAELKQILTTKHTDTTGTTSKAMSETQSSSYKDLRSSPTLRQAVGHLVPQPTTTSSLNRRLKAGPSVSSSHVTALPGSAGAHRRQASWGAWYGVGGSPGGEHRRHNSTSSYKTSPLEIQEITSYQSSKTKATTVSSQTRVEQSRVNTESVLNEVFAESDLILDEDCENNLKLYVDTHQGGTVMTGHELADRRRFRQIDVSSETTPVRPARRHTTTQPSTPSE